MISFGNSDQPCHVQITSLNISVMKSRNPIVLRAKKYKINLDKGLKYKVGCVAIFFYFDIGKFSLYLLSLYLQAYEDSLSKRFSAKVINIDLQIAKLKWQWLYLHIFHVAYGNLCNF